MQMPRSEKYHGYVNHLAVLDNGKTVKILGGEGLKLFVKDLDGLAVVKDGKMIYITVKFSRLR